MIENLARIGIVAGSYDDREIWEVAAMLGANRADDEDAPGPVAVDPLQFKAM